MAMSCQRGVVGDPESTLIQNFASISRPASAASRALSRAVGRSPARAPRSCGQATLRVETIGNKSLLVD
jgi:hypothetical protein